MRVPSGPVMSAAAGRTMTTATPSTYPLLAAGGCALFAWLTPTHELPWTTFHAEAAMALALAIAAGWVLWKGRRRPAALPMLTLLTLLVALVPLVQLAGGLIAFGGDAAMASVYLVGFAGAQIAGERAVTIWGTERPLTTVAWVVLAGAVTSVWLALCQWQQLDYLGIALVDLPSEARPFANFNQPNLLATLVLLGLLATAILFDTGRLGAAVASLVVAMLGFGLVLTQSRAGLLGLMLAGALLLARRRRLDRRLGGRQVLGGLALVLAMMPAWEAVRALTAQAGGRDSAAMLEAGTRNVHWRSMLDAIMRHPWSGYGWNQVDAAQFAVAPDHPATGEVLAYSHSLVLDLLVWNGVPLGSAIIVGLALWFWLAWRGARNSTAVLALACVIAVFVHALVEYPLYYAYFLLPTGLLMGGLCPTTMPRAALAVPAWLPPLLLLPTCAVLLLIGSDYLRLEEDVRSLRYERARIGVDRPPHELSSPVLLTQLGAFVRFARTPERNGMTEAELQSMAAVVLRFPSGPNIVRYAAALAINDRPVPASDALRRVCKMNSPRTCDAMKVLWRGLGEREPAIERVPWPRD